MHIARRRGRKVWVHQTGLVDVVGANDEKAAGPQPHWLFGREPPTKRCVSVAGLHIAGPSLAGRGDREARRRDGQPWGF
jgi:hypothetical protein